MDTTSTDDIQQRRAFVHWLRTGRQLNADDFGIELKFNPWHDPEDGRFTHAGAGKYFGPGSAKSTDGRANRERKITDASTRKAVSRNPVRKVAEFADSLRQGVYDVGKEAVTGLYEVATTNPATTVRDFGESVAKTIDAAVAAEDTPARVQVSQAADAVANASARPGLRDGTSHRQCRPCRRSCRRSGEDFRRAQTPGRASARNVRSAERYVAKGNYYAAR